MAVEVFYPWKNNVIDHSQIEKGNGDFTDFLSWLLSNVKRENYEIEFRVPVSLDDRPDDCGWVITFKHPQHAMLFKLIWV